MLDSSCEAVAQIEQIEQQGPQQRALTVVRFGFFSAELLFEHRLARFKGSEDRTELVERILDQARFGPHLVAHRGQLDEDAEQIAARVGRARRFRHRFDTVEVAAELVEQGLLRSGIHSVSLPHEPATRRPVAGCPG